MGGSFGGYNMRAFVAIVAAANMTIAASGSAFAFDPSTGQSWQRSRPPMAVAYFRLPFQAGAVGDNIAYGLALTAPTPRSYSAAPVSITDTPRLLDLRFNGAVPDSLRVTGQVAWAHDL